MATNVTLKRVNNTSGATDELHPTTDWSQIESKPSTFTPTSHTHLDYAKRIDLTSQVQLTSYRKSVIALCNIDNSSISRNSWSGGTIFFHRTNGLQAPVSLHITMEKRYNAQGANYTAMALSGNSFGDNIQYVQFDYNGTPYGGIEFKFSDAEHGQVYFIGESNFDIFGLDYYRTDTSTALNTEVNNSISTTDMVAETDFFINNQKVFHAGNDGSGSGLDADTLDGIDSGSFLQKTGGTLTGTLTSRAIAMQNYNLTGVNMLQFNDPGPNEGIDWSGGNFKIYESPDDLTTNSAGNLQFVTGGTRRMTIGNDGYLYVSNTVQTPQLQMTSNQNKTKLRVWSGGTYGIGMHSNYTFGGLGTTGGEYAMTFQMNDDNDRGFWWGDSAHNEAQGAMALTTAGKLTVADKIRVGYGQLDTTDPSTYAVDASGDILISNSNPVLQLKDTDTSASAYLDYQAGTSLKVHAGADPIAFIAGNSEKARLTAGNGYLGIGTTNPSYGLDVHANGGQIRAYGTTAKVWAEASDSGQASLELKNTEGHLRFITDNGAFQLYDQTDAAERFVIDTNGNWTFGLGDEVTLRGDLNLNYNFPRIHFTDTDDNSDFSLINANGQFGLYDDTNSTYRIAVESNGNVGIGTESAASKLEVNGDIQLQRSNEIIFGETVGGNPRAVIFSTENEFSSDYNGLGFSIGNQGRTGPSMYIRSDGKVGIGTTTPAEKLTVSGKVRANDNFEHLGSGGYYLYTDAVGFRGAFYDNGSVTSIYGDGNGSTPVININSDNVGIGTETPSAKLNIVDDTSGSDLAKFRNDTDTTDVTIKTTSGAIAVIKSGGGDQLQLSANNTDTNGIRITTAGNVGIGETSVDTQLHISDPNGPVIKLEDPGTVSWRIGTSGTDLRISHNSDTVATSVLNIDNTGNVGVGTQSPAYAVDVAGDVNVTGNFKVNGTNISTGEAAEPEWEYLTKVTGSSQMTYSSMVPADYEYKFVVELQTTGEDTSNPYIRINNEGTQEYSYQYQSVTQTSETGETALNAGDALTSLIYTGADLSSYSSGGTSGSTVHRAEFIYSVSPYTTSPGAYTATIRGWAHTHWVSQSGTSYDGMVQSTFVGTRDNLFFTEHTRLDYIHSINAGGTDYHEMRVYRRPRK